MNETNRPSAEPVADYEEMRERMMDAEEHRKGLLVHSQNLEHLLNEALTHAKNLEAMLCEKELDVNQSRVRIQELESQVYRYEQMLNDAGVKLT